jgi:hypothetical protein
MEPDMHHSETLLAQVIRWHARVALVALVVVTVMNARQTVRAEPGVAATTGAAQAPELAWPNEAYRVDWEEAYVPLEADANRMQAVPVTLRNSGNKVWPASVVFVSYHWFRDGKLVVWDGERTRLPRDVRAGGRATLAVHVKTPAEPGAYVLQLTLVHENVIWFEHKGANMFIRPVAVGAANESIGVRR